MCPCDFALSLQNSFSSFVLPSDRRIQFYENLYDESGQECGGKFVCQNNEVKKTNEEPEDLYAESSEESGQEDIDLVEDEDTSIESDSDVWFITYNSFYRTRDIGGIEINVMNDAVMFVQCTGSDETVAEWEMNLKPAEIGDDGEYIYYYGKGIKMSYYPCRKLACRVSVQ